MNMIEFIAGAVLGAGGMVARDFLTGNGQQANAAQKRETEQLYAENEKLRDRNKQAERQIEDLLAEVAQLRKKSKSTDNDRDDLQDELDSAKAKVRKLTTQNDELLRKVKEYQNACANYEQEISRMKNG
jgi:chromosome segregation ATPase